MPHVDQIVLALLAVSLVASLVVHWRRGMRGGRLVVVALATFYGLTLVTMLAFHCVDILHGLAHGLPSMTGKPITYDWRTCSLLLFGALLVWLGVECVRAALRMGRGDPAARTCFLRLTALVLAIVAPIIPIHAFFGYLISGASALTLVVVAAGWRAPRVAAPPLDAGYVPRAA